MRNGCVCFSGSVTSEKSVESCTDGRLANSLSTVSSDREIPSADTDDTSDCVSVASVPADATVEVRTTNPAESSDNVSRQTVSEETADDGTFRFRRRRTKRVSGSSQIQKICEVCGKGFRHYESFRSHTRKHAGQPPRCRGSPGKQRSSRGTVPTKLPLMCDACGLRGKNADAFARHVRTYHPSALGVDNAGAPYRCRSCDEKFYRRRVLLHHVRLVHTPNPPPKKTSWLRRPQRPRGSGLPSCSHCYRCFGSRLALEAHERVHTGAKPYSCPECGRCFRQSVHLTAHVRTHSDERPFRCSECPKAYRNRVDLRKHCSRRHGVTLPVKRQRLVAGIDVVAEAVAAADIGPDDADDSVHPHPYQQSWDVVELMVNS